MSISNTGVTIIKDKIDFKKVQQLVVNYSNCCDNTNTNIDFIQ
jgi:hypothetical protein